MGVFISSATMSWTEAQGQDVLRYSSSAQVHDVLLEDTLQAFTKETGIKVDLFVCSSSAATYRLFNGVCGVASTAEGLEASGVTYGYVETFLCKIPLVLVANVETHLKNITEKQLQDVFTGHLTNWKDLGDSNKEMVVVIPGKNTAAFKNFSHLAIRRYDIKYDFMTYHSTMILEAIRRIPWSISFIGAGAPTNNAAIRILRVNGYAATDKEYPYIQTLSFVTRGEPAGAVKKFIDFAKSEANLKRLKAKGAIILDNSSDVESWRKAIRQWVLERARGSGVFIIS